MNKSEKHKVVVDTNPDKTMYICYILDQSGSMSSIKDETITAFNKWKNDFAKEPTTVNTKMSLTKFNTKCDITCVAENLDNVKNLTKETYIPSGMTTLYDSIANTILELEKKLEEDKKTNDNSLILCIIHTDGQENSSIEYKREDIVAMIKEREQEGKGNWSFIYMGVGQDAWAQSGTLGIMAGNVMSVHYSSVGARFGSGGTYKMSSVLRRKYAVSDSLADLVQTRGTLGREAQSDYDNAMANKANKKK